jgi:putative transposase
VPRILPASTGRRAGRVPALSEAQPWHSFTYKEYGNGACLDNGSLVLSKIGRIAVRWSRPIEGTIKSVTVSREADGWYVCFSCAEVPMHPLPLTGRETGIDVGLKVFLITAEGEVVENPRHYRIAEKRLKKAQRRVTRRKKGGNRRRKAVHLLKRTHQQVQRQRRAFHHKTALSLVRQYDTIYLEDLHVANMSRRPKPKPDGNGGYVLNGASAKAGLNKSINDAGWCAFRVILACKAAYAGKRVEAVPAAYTSQECSGCGERIHKACLCAPTSARTAVSSWTAIRTQR